MRPVSSFHGLMSRSTTAVAPTGVGGGAAGAGAASLLHAEAAAASTTAARRRRGRDRGGILRFIYGGDLRLASAADRLSFCYWLIVTSHIPHDSITLPEQPGR